MLPRKQLPPLEAVRAFEAAARRGSFVAAAQEVHVTASAISYQIKRLEAWIGQPLFERKANGIVLTRRGQVYALQVRAAFDELVANSQEAKAPESFRTVRICAQHSMARLWLLPKAQQLRERCLLDGIRIYVGEDSASAKTDADITIFHHRIERASHVQLHLLSGHFRAYAAPALLRRTRVRTPEALRLEPWIAVSMEERGWRYPNYDAWFAAANVAPPDRPAVLTVNLLYMAADACMRGEGFGFLLDELCADAVANGALVALPGPVLESPHAYFVRYKRNANETVKRVAAEIVEMANARTP
jgi:LysR family transcriptional regulator, glycine cleavage system transcriptional activator